MTPVMRLLILILVVLAVVNAVAGHYGSAFATLACAASAAYWYSRSTRRSPTRTGRA